MKNPVIALALLVLVLLPFPVSAEYMPSGGLLEFFTSLAEKEPMKDSKERDIIFIKEKKDANSTSSSIHSLMRMLLYLIL